MNRHVASPSSLRRRAKARNTIHARTGAFTLVELMIVIIIIGILAGLLSVAAYNAVLAARKTRVKAEIDNMSMQLQQYASDRGEIPPCLGDRNVTRRQDNFVAHLRKAFPRFTLVPNSPPEPLSYLGPSGNSGLKKYVQTVYGNSLSGQPLNIDDIDQAEALVLWLGGPPATPSLAASTKLLGWSANVSNPFQPTGSRVSGGFAFDETRLVDLDQDGWYEYTPAVTSPAGPTPPYVYFDAASYNVVPGTNQPVYFYPTNKNMNLAPKTPQNMVGQWGTAVPYMAKLPPPPPPSNPPWIMVNPKSFQIISAGLDSIYSQEGYQGPPQPMTDIDKYPRFPSGDNYFDGGQDNLTNFSPGALKDEIP